MIQAVDPGGGLFAHAAQAGCELSPFLRILGQSTDQQALHQAQFFGFAADGGHFQFGLILPFQPAAFMHHQRGVSPIVDDEIRSAFRPTERVHGATPVFFQSLALPGKDGDALGGDGSRGVVLRGEDIAAAPADLGTQFQESFDEHGSLDGHM